MKTLTLAQQEVLCRALTASARPEAANVLGDCMGQSPELDSLVIDGLVELSLRYPWRVRIDVLSPLRARLESKDPAVRASSAEALGRFRDRAAISALIVHLADKDDGTARAALWSVRRIAGRADLQGAVDSQRWLDGEMRWWKEEGLTLLEDLDDPTPGALPERLRTLATHALGREQVIDALVAALPDYPNEAKVLACTTLAALEARDSVPALVELLFSDDEGVRKAAWDALRAVTGEKLPNEPRLWERYAAG